MIGLCIERDGNLVVDFKTIKRKKDGLLVSINLFYSFYCFLQGHVDIFKKLTIFYVL